MTIEYKDSKRIVGLSTDMSSNIVTINHRLSSTDDHAYADLGSALSNSSWVMRYKMVISGYSASSSNPNNSYLFTIAKTNTAEQDTQSLGLKLQIGGSGGSVAKVSGNTSSQSSGEGYGGGGDFTTTVANATWYIECIRNGADFSVRITTNSDYTGGENKTWSTSGTVEDLRYIKYTNRDDSSSSWVLVSTISDIKIYDGVTSATGTFVRDGTWTASASNKVTVATQDIKPTDIQNNSILVEKDTGKRYWFSKATVPTYTPTIETADWTLTNGGGSATIANDVITIVNNSSGDNPIATYDLGATISDTEWVMTFQVLFSGFQNSASGNGTKLGIGISSSSSTSDLDGWNTSGTSFIEYDFRGHASTSVWQPHVAGGNSSGRTETVGTNTPDGGGYSATQYVKLYRLTSTTARMEFYLQSDYSDTPVTLNVTMANVPSSLRYVFVRSFYENVSDTNTFVISNFKIYNAVTSASPATWTREGALDKTGLKAYWRFNQTSGNIINQAEAIGSTDSADNTTGAGGSDLTTSGVTYNVNKSPMNYSLQFDGSNDYAKAGTSTSAWNFMHSTTAKWTLCFWADMTGNGSGTVMSTSATSNTNVGLQIICTNANGTFRARVTDGGGVVTQLITSSGFVPQDNAMHFYKITYDQSLSSDNMKMSVDNGTNVTQTKAGNAPTDGNAYQAMYIGMSTTSDFPCAGEFAEMSIWNRVLTDAEVTKIYNSGSGVFPLF